jgi:hypothetical protein
VKCTYVIPLKRKTKNMSINAIIRITLNEANKTQYSMVTMKTFAVQYNLDQKQQIACECICSSFMLLLLIESGEDKNKVYV